MTPTEIGWASNVAITSGLDYAGKNSFCYDECRALKHYYYVINTTASGEECVCLPHPLSGKFQCH